jgi:hypothetical protein
MIQEKKTSIITVNVPITGGLLKLRVKLSPTDLIGIRAHAVKVAEQTVVLTLFLNLKCTFLLRVCVA